ncbi:chromosomal protein D1-like [Nerophis ophidion]|uniref:chromosomal protein D1-like n=1 Tax=Nerophis ophidion TaxID=159077 RepID=UPI002AE09434|nr:chromosomal protein D1-like [Nerophis ophidion]XP_061753485.1 chromosomal protein D1-like [Nerophis ophidion]XP_061753486.1 chromosomal protein D1-like [Nerophis ophidion]
MEEDLRVVEEEQGDVLNQDASSEENSDNNFVKRGRGRPRSSKKPKVNIADLNLMELVSGISNSEPAVGFKNLAGGEEYTPKKRGRPSGSVNKRTAEKALDNSSSGEPKRGRGRPMGSGKRKVENLSSDDESNEWGPKKRGRPKSSAKKTPKPKEVELDENGIPKTPRGRGRPRMSSSERKQVPADDPLRPKRGRGRPRGSLNKKMFDEVRFQAGRPRRKHIPPSRLEIRVPRKTGKRGRPRNEMSGRGRPRKYPLPSTEGSKKRGWKPLGRPRKHPLVGVPGKAAGGRGRGRPRKSEAGTGGHLRKYEGSPRKRGRPRKYPLSSTGESPKPKIWKPLGRPRKHPLVDPPEGAAPRRNPGRPRKSESKRGAHLRNPNSKSRPPKPILGADGTPRKRGRPKGSVNKNKEQKESEVDSEPWNHSDADNAAADAEEEQVADVPAEEEEEDEEERRIESEDGDTQE